MLAARPGKRRRDMHCPRCQFEGNMVYGRCARCGYVPAQGSSGSLRVAPIVSTPSPRMVNPYTLMRGDTLSQGRYRIVNQIVLPEPQQKQAAAWEAQDLQVLQRRVVIRQFVVPPALPGTTSAGQI